MRGAILLGGGIDSTSLLVYLRKVFPDIELFGLHVMYGQKAFLSESKANRHFSLKYEVPLKMVGVQLEEIATASILERTPMGTEQKENCLEGRNVVLISLAATYARTIRADCIYVGFHAEPTAAPFPDATQGALLVMQDLMEIAYSTNVKLEAPFAELTRTEIFRLGVSLDPEVLTHTFTCYEGGEKECGKCVHCKTKERMVKELNVRHSVSEK